MGKAGSADDVDMSTPVRPSTTAAFMVQAAISFGVSLAACAIGIAYLPVGGWIRAFLGLALLYAVTSTFTLAKCVRDRQETATITGRVDQARLDRLLAEHDPFNATP
ncbi:YiaA/YiaB family inner membrane protein [Actinoallomurus acanthiterrae]